LFRGFVRAALSHSRA
jgi:hypothetical protein